MEQNRNPATPDKKYPFRFSPAIIAVFALGLILCATCFSLSTWYLVEFIRNGNLSSVYEWIKFFLLYFVSVFLSVLIVSMLIRSEYVITDKYLILRFGVIRSKYELKKIFSVCLLNGSKKLNVYFDDFKTRYMTIAVKEEWYDDFIQTLISRNERIGFDFFSREEEDKNKKK